jgi:ribosomal peptide maturation radical SAM protein 1
VGFSSSYSQNLASLCLAQLLKQRWPHIHITFGGANCRDSMGEALLREFPFVDSVFLGEADETFPAFVRQIRSGRYPRQLPGVIWRERGKNHRRRSLMQVPQLDSLPAPDFDDYFRQLRQEKLHRFVPVRISVETSRGCWWQKCVFCEYGKGGCGYRIKKLSQCVGDIVAARRRYGVTRFHLVDNIVDHRHFQIFFPALARLRPKIRLECQVKSNITLEQAQLLQSAGAVYVQPGIESLSSAVLKLMRKGVTALQNVACLKHCRQAGLKRVVWHLLYGFPFEDAKEYQRILEVLRRITHFACPHFVQPMRLLRQSPAYVHADALGFTRIRPHWMYRHIYPFDEAVRARLAYRFDFEFPDRRDPEVYVGPIKDFVRLWRAHAGQGNLYYEATDKCAGLIHDSRFNRVAPVFKLDRFQNAIYRYCDEIRNLRQIEEFVARRFGDEAANRGHIQEVIQTFWQNQLIVMEGDSCLAVAIKQRRQSRKER